MGRRRRRVAAILLRSPFRYGGQEPQPRRARYVGMRDWISPLVGLFLLGLSAYVFASLHQAGTLTGSLAFLE